ncbi:MAG: hypothetical protein QM723_18600 [Myxococcaceae bacterium]
MLSAHLLTLCLSAAPASTACDTKAGDFGTICTEVRLGKDEAAAAFEDRCKKSNGTAKATCEAKPAARCLMGDTTLNYYLAAGKTGDVAAGFVHGGKVSCFSRGGSFEPKPKAAAKPAAALALPALKASTKGAGDCQAEEVFGSVKISCGGEDRAEVTLTVAAYTGDVGQPARPETVVADLKSDAPGATVTELAKKNGKDGWQVQFSAASPHAVTAYGFDEVRTVGGAKLLCIGTAWNKADLDAAVKMCGALTAAK